MAGIELIRPDAWGEVAQDVNTAITIGKWSAIIGTGYMLHKNRAVGLRLLYRQGWAVGTAAFRLAIQIGTIWYEEVLVDWRVTKWFQQMRKSKGVTDLVKNPKSGVWEKPKKWYQRAPKPGGMKPIRNWKPGGKFGGGGASAFVLFGGIMVQAIINVTDELEEWLGSDLTITGNDEVVY